MGSEAEGRFTTLSEIVTGYPDEYFDLLNELNKPDYELINSFDDGSKMYIKQAGQKEITVRVMPSGSEQGSILAQRVTSHLSDPEIEFFEFRHEYLTADGWEDYNPDDL